MMISVLYFSGIFCESIMTTVSARYTGGSERTMATAHKVTRTHATVMRIFLFQIVRSIESREKAGRPVVCSSASNCALLAMFCPVVYRNMGTKEHLCLFSLHCGSPRSFSAP